MEPRREAEGAAAVGNPVAVRIIAGRYQLQERLGSGGMGTVWRATDMVLARDVAIKEVTFPRGVSEEEREVLRERTRREARAAARLDHPSAVTVYDVTEEDGTPYLVMELVEARTLSEVVRTDGPLTAHATAKLGLAVLGALEAAHAQGIVHRDVKPGNVLLREDGRVVLTDFGIATFTGDSSITSAGLLLGSPSYIAPERARGQAPGPASDLWSLGATLFTAVEGVAPYDKGEPLPTMTAVVTGDRAPFVAAGPLQSALEGLLEADPEQRLDAAAARAALTAVVRSTGADDPITQAVPHLVLGSDRTSALSVQDVQVEVAGKRRRALVPAVALAGVAVAGVLFAVANQDGGMLGGGSAGIPTPSASTSAAPLPTDWRTISGSAGWQTGVPPSYAESTFSGAPQWKDRETGRTLRIATGAGRTDAVADREAQAAVFAGGHDAYQQLRIEKVDYRGYAAADWEFTYRDGGASLRALNRYFVAGGTGYSVFFQTRSSDDWTAARKDFDQILASFAP